MGFSEGLVLAACLGSVPSYGSVSSRSGMGDWRLGGILKSFCIVIVKEFTLQEMGPSHLRGCESEPVLPSRAKV